MENQPKLISMAEDIAGIKVSLRNIERRLDLLPCDNNTKTLTEMKTQSRNIAVIFGAVAGAVLGALAQLISPR